MKIEQPKKLLSDTAYDLILKALFNEELEFGARLSQKDLARVTGTAIGPIRDALKALESDGLVVVHPRSGIEIIAPSTELARSTYQYRAIIERAAARQFAANASTEDIIQMRDKHIAMIDLLESVESHENLIARIQQIEDAFHGKLMLSLNNELVNTSFRRLHLLSRFIKVSAFMSSRAAQTTLREHLSVLDACMDRDIDAAGELIEKHLLNALNRNLGLQ